ncbi:unnamed protein product [Protopolystoma xenopodis]|uniref:Uncharacterized protein n=1 Tax=Protopolystoma xenopodis TaxID=117903 RepID=A0A3S5C753_9PLAT|nr:unnamed protein product [Protopolystoma xenopodis]
MLQGANPSGDPGCPSVARREVAPEADEPNSEEHNDVFFDALEESEFERFRVDEYNLFFSESGIYPKLNLFCCPPHYDGRYDTHTFTAPCLLLSTARGLSSDSPDTSRPLSSPLPSDNPPVSRICPIMARMMLARKHFFTKFDAMNDDQHLFESDFPLSLRPQLNTDGLGCQRRCDQLFCTVHTSQPQDNPTFGSEQVNSESAFT